MVPLSESYLITGHTYMRKSINGLSLIVSDVLEMDPLSRVRFIFCNRQRNKLKILFPIITRRLPAQKSYGNIAKF